MYMFIPESNKTRNSAKGEAKVCFMQSLLHILDFITVYMNVKKNIKISFEICVKFETLVFFDRDQKHTMSASCRPCWIYTPIQMGIVNNDICSISLIINVIKHFNSCIVLLLWANSEKSIFVNGFTCIPYVVICYFKYMYSLQFGVL